MARKERAQSGDMAANEGDEVRRRRERIGMDKVRLAKEAGISRETLAAVENGQGFRPSTLAAIQRALDAAEEEAGITAPPAQDGPELVEFEVEGERVIVRGPVANADQLAAMVAKLIRDSRQEPGE